MGKGDEGEHSVSEEPGFQRTPADHPSSRLPSKHWKGKDLSQAEESKVIQILAACEDPRDHGSLITLATSTHGLVDDELRREACKSEAWGF